jgi:myo-inositol-1-phosphate synthase
MLISYLPVGSQIATEWWANIAIEYKLAFVNCMPVFIASNPEWAQKFADAGVPVLGDDMKGQVGATIVHRVLAKMANDRGVKIDSTYQLNVGGNTDFLNMKEQERLVSKKISKTDSVQSQLEVPLDVDQVHIGPSDFIPFLKNTKIAYIRLEGKQWAEIPYNMELRLEVDDKANSSGVVIDAIRCAKLALDRGMSGAIEIPSAFLFKHPPKQYSDSEAKRMLEEFSNG